MVLTVQKHGGAGETRIALWNADRLGATEHVP